MLPHLRYREVSHTLQGSLNNLSIRRDEASNKLLNSARIVNRCRLVMKLDKFLCFMFLFAFLALTLHKTRQKHAFFGRITNQKLRLIYSKFTCEQKQKIVQGHGRFNI